MNYVRSSEDLNSIVRELKKLPNETEWVEFKKSQADPVDIGEYISALSNSAALEGKVSGYILWGIQDTTHEIVGTSFRPVHEKIGNEALESWLLRLMQPKIDFKFFETTLEGKLIVLLEIQAAYRHPVRFQNIEYIRIGSYKKKLKDFPEKERLLWRLFDRVPFEKQIAMQNVTSGDVLKLLNFQDYFRLLNLPLPGTEVAQLNCLKEDSLIQAATSGKWNIANLGAILFARNLKDFPGMQRKTVRVIIYKGNNRITTEHEKAGGMGYASGFEGLIQYILKQLPANEVVGIALRKEVPLFPPVAIRELVANAIIHQDFYQTGTGPMIEVFSNRIEITNPGLPLVSTNRFLDSPPKSRNELLASFMRRIGVCEERGSGIDKVVFQTELFQLPAPLFEVTDEHTRAVLFAFRPFKKMDKSDRVRACYLHACLRYVERDFMTNTTLRARFGIDEKNSAIVSRIIKDTLDAGLIMAYDEDASRKFMKYIPCWAR